MKKGFILSFEAAAHLEYFALKLFVPGVFCCTGFTQNVTGVASLALLRCRDPVGTPEDKLL